MAQDKMGEKILKEYLVLCKEYPIKEASCIQAQQFSHPNPLQHYLQEDEPQEEKL